MVALGSVDINETVRLLGAEQRVFSRFTLRRKLGQGGMGVVWLAFDEELGLEIAMKFLPEYVRRDKEAVADLKREAKRCLLLTHPNIVRIYDFHADADMAAITMEYVDGESLASRKADSPNRCLGITELRPLVAQMCRALDYAHIEAQIVHRDLKPGNLMVGKSGALKVADFGIAHSISDARTRLTSAGLTTGTIPYMSPQQLMGEYPSVGDDIYSLGATLYDLLTGKPPFYSGEIPAQIMKIEPAPLGERRRALGNGGEPIPSEWEEAISFCLAKEPGDRPQSVREVAARLGLGTGESISTLRRRPRWPAQTRRKFCAAALAALVLILGGMVWSMTSPRVGGSSRRPPKPVVAVSAADSSPDGRKDSAPSPKETASDVGRPSRSGQTWKNSLGMRFVMVGDVLVSIWETRVQDYSAFTRATGHSREAPSFPQSPAHPAVNVSWEDAMAFCQWLTEKERREGLLEEGQVYRLPTDEEWSRAVGLDKEGDGLPQDLDKRIKGIFPWGKEWPPPKTAGNYAFGDEYPQTAPVGIFPPNALGIYDLGGNVWEWCMDWHNGEHLCRVLRGASWYNGDPDDPDLLLSSCRVDRFPERRKDTNGFRCVLASSALPVDKQ